MCVVTFIKYLVNTCMLCTYICIASYPDLPMFFNVSHEKSGNNENM